MAFTFPKKSDISPDNPYLLLRDLHKRKIPEVWPHQKTTLLLYADNEQKHKDIAIWLPTGSGKTLVGLLIAEWRRRKYGEKVVYLGCVM